MKLWGGGKNCGAVFTAWVEWNSQGNRAREFSFEDFLRQSPLKSSIHAGTWLCQQLRFTGRSEAIAFLEIIRLVQVERSKGQISSRLQYYADEIAPRVGEVYWSSKRQDQEWKVTNLPEMFSLILRRTLNETVSVFWSSRKLFSVFIFAYSLLLCIFLIKLFTNGV